ncbi:MAG: hypothetical protein KF771_12555 [Burkholderiales bacterium]|nr:hypothetical protein [Burkholderiales bacterium]
MAMNPGPDMEHDPQLAEIYRAGAEAGPSSALDDAIRAAARREVKAGPHRSGLRRWQLPLSLAAVLVLSVTVVTQMREQGADRPEALLSPPTEVQPRAAEQSRIEPVPPQVAAVPEAEVLRRDKPARAPERPAAPVIQAPAEPPPAMASEQKMMAAPTESLAAPAGAGAATAEDATGARPERQAPRPLLRSAPAPLADSPVGSSAAAPARSAVPAAPEPAALWRDLATAPPEQWIKRIVELRRAGKIADADALAAEFGRRFPDARLPAEAR